MCLHDIFIRSVIHTLNHPCTLSIYVQLYIYAFNIYTTKWVCIMKFISININPALEQQYSEERWLAAVATGSGGAERGGGAH